MKPETKIVAVAVAISLGLSVGYNLLLPQKVKETVREVITLGSAGNEYGENVKFNDGATFATRATGGGVLRGDGMPFISASTTVCSIQSPTNATSTLVVFNLYTTQNATTTAREVSVATSTVPFATTSPIADGSTMVVTAGAEYSLSLGPATTSSAGGSQFSTKYGTFAPGTWLTASFKGGNQTFGIGSSSNGATLASALTGSCSALWLTEGR